VKKTVDDVTNEMIDVMGEESEKFGFTRTAGMLKGLLLVSDRPLSLDEMADMLEVSKASVSTNIRFLERWKVARRVYNRKDRRNYYELRGDIWEIETEIISTIAKDAIARFRELTARWEKDLESVGDDEAERRDSLLAKFKNIKEYVEAVEYFMNMLISKGGVTPALIKTIKID
jgi:DNA-binding transcriptional regulator GbsR (MarR family)